MAFWNENTEIFNLTGTDGQTYKITFDPNSALFSDDNMLVSFHVDGADYHYKSNVYTHSMAADLIKNTHHIATGAIGGAAFGAKGAVTGMRQGAIAGAAIMSAVEIARHFIQHSESGYFNNGRLVFEGPVFW